MGVNGGFVDGPNASGGFREEDHPRDAEGKFAPGSGESDVPQGDGAGSGAGGESPGAEDETSAPRNNRPPASRGAYKGKPGFIDITDNEEERERIGVPKIYIEAWANQDISEDNPIIWEAVRPELDAKGKLDTVRKYTPEHIAKQLVEKFQRNRVVSQAMPGIMAKLDNVQPGDRDYDAARALRLITETGARVGGEHSESKGEPTYGVTTLKADHIIPQPDGSVHIDFVGKAAVRNVYKVTEPDVCQDLETRKKAAASGDDQVFKARDTDLRRVIKKASGHPEFKVHDIRTWMATETAERKMDLFSEPTSPSEFWHRYDACVDAAAKQINDEFETAEKNYVNPVIFTAWRASAGVPHGDPRPKGSERPKKPKAPKLQSSPSSVSPTSVAIASSSVMGGSSWFRRCHSMARAALSWPVGSRVGVGSVGGLMVAIIPFIWCPSPRGAGVPGSQHYPG